MPLVLGGDSIPLDLGRHQRLFSTGQVKAARATRAVCQAEGCTIPSRWCEAHHLDPWAAGGRTDIANLALLCSHHHHRIHDPPTSTAGPAAPTLSEREREVAELLLLGRPYRDIGAQLLISAKTVEHHVARIRRRLGAESRSEMLSMLRALLDSPPPGPGTA